MSIRLITQVVQELTFKNGGVAYGFFVPFGDYETLKEKNMWRFIPKSKAIAFQQEKSKELSIVVEGDNLIELIMVKNP